MLFKSKKICAVRKTAIATVALILFLLADTLIVAWDSKNCSTSWKSKVRGLFIVQEIYAKVLSNQQEALQKLLPDAEEIREETKVLTDEQKQRISREAKVAFDPVLDQEFKIFIGINDGSIVGYAIKDAVKGKHDLIHYMVACDSSGRIQKVIVLEYHEKRGKPIAKRRFLKQFQGKTISSRIRLKKDINGVTGATISSRGITDGIRKIIHVLNEFYPIKLDK